MASVKIYPRLDKTNDEQKAPLYLRITKNRKSQSIALDVYIHPSDWNAKNSKVKSATVNAERINGYIASKIASAEAVALDLETKSTWVTALDIKTRIMGRIPSDFFAFVRKREEIVNKEYSVGSIRRYRCVVEKFKTFLGKDVLYFDAINTTLIRDFQQHLLTDCENHVNTVNANLKVIRKILNDAIAEELLPMEKNPFNKIKIKGMPTKRNFLLDDELQKLEELQLPKHSQINHHRNLYVFSAYACGIRISDLLMMRWQNVSDGRLCFQIRKTQEQIGVKLPPKALEILEFYREFAKRRYGYETIPARAFIFPLIKLDYTELDRVKIHKAISSATGYTNRDLKTLQEKAKLTKNITFHTARHSWAVRALQKGMRIEYVSKLMGHASVKHTEVYAKVLDTELDKAMEIFNR